MYALQVIRQFLPEIGTAVGLITAALAYRNYHKQTKLERLKWLQQLYESFYKDNRYRPMRQRIDFDDLDDLLPLLRKNETRSEKLSQAQRDQLDEFTDYLNFFEWIAFLEHKGQLPFKDLDVMFNYYLCRIVQIDKQHQNKISKYIKENGYEQFLRLLTDRYLLTA
jgi:hypothetical protein